MAKKMIIRADDLGYSKGVNYGILEAIKGGLLKNAGVMINMPTAKHGINLVESYDIDLGLHINISAGKPISDPSLIASLVEGEYFKSSKVYRASEVDFVNYDEVCLEIENQIDAYLELVGREPDYVDFHAISSENFMRALRDVTKKRGLLFIDIGFDGVGFELNNQRIEANPDFLFDEYSPLETFNSCVEKIQDGIVTLLIVHPGYLDAYIMENSTLLYPRIQEVKVLTSESAHTWLNKHKVKVYKFSEI